MALTLLYQKSLFYGQVHVLGRLPKAAKKIIHPPNLAWAISYHKSFSYGHVKVFEGGLWLQNRDYIQLIWLCISYIINLCFIPGLMLWVGQPLVAKEGLYPPNLALTLLYYKSLFYGQVNVMGGRGYGCKKWISSFGFDSLLSHTIILGKVHVLSG